MIFAPHKLYTSIPVSLPVAGGGSLEIQTGEFVPYRVCVSPLRGTEIDSLMTTVELVDADGYVYQGNSHIAIEEVLRQMGSLTAMDPVISLSPEERARRLVDGRTFFQDAKGLFDDRFYHSLVVDEMVWVIPFHYQQPRVALYYSGEERFGTLWMHAVVSGFEGFRVTDNPQVGGVPEMIADDLDDPDDDEYFDDDEEDDLEPELVTMPDLHFSVDLKPFYFLNHYGQPGDGERMLVPRPVEFERLDTARRAANPLIVHQLHESQGR